MPLTYAGQVGPEDALVEAVVDGLTAAAGTGGAGVILGINRGLGTETARHSLDLALRWAGRGVVALGLAGGEAGYPGRAVRADAQAGRRDRDAVRATRRGDTR